MERQAPRSAGDVLRDLLQETSLQSRMNELRAIELWPKIVGEEISRLTGRPAVKNGVMWIGVPNASLRNELHINRSSLLRFINDYFGKEIIIEIRFVS